VVRAFSPLRVPALRWQCLRPWLLWRRRGLLLAAPLISILHHLRRLRPYQTHQTIPHPPLKLICATSNIIIFLVRSTDALLELVKIFGVGIHKSLPYGVFVHTLDDSGIRTRFPD